MNNQTTIFQSNIINAQNSVEFWKKSNKKFQDQYIPITIKDRLSNHSYLNSLNDTAKTPVIIKIVSKQAGSYQVKNTINYLTREDKKEEENLNLEDEQGRVYKNKDQANQLVEDWKKDFLSKERIKSQSWKVDANNKILKEYHALQSQINKQSNNPSRQQEEDLKLFKDQVENQYIIQTKIDPKTNKPVKKKISTKLRGVSDTTHIILSVGGKSDIDHATMATRHFLQNNFAANGFRFTFVAHNDTKNLHFHALIKNQNLFGKNLHFTKDDLFVLKQDYAHTLGEYGIQRISSLRRDKTQTLQKIHKNIENIRENKNWYQIQLKKRRDNSKEFTQEIQSQDEKIFTKEQKNMISFLKEQAKKLHFQIKQDKNSKSASIRQSQKVKQKKFLKSYIRLHLDDLKQAKKIIKIYQEGQDNQQSQKYQKNLVEIDKMLAKVKKVSRSQNLSM